MTHKQATPLVSMDVDPRSPSPSPKSSGRLWTKGMKLLTENDWLSPAVAALVMATAHVSGCFASPAGDSRTVAFPVLVSC